MPIGVALRGRFACRVEVRLAAAFQGRLPHLRTSPYAFRLLTAPTVQPMQGSRNLTLCMW